MYLTPVNHLLAADFVRACVRLYVSTYKMLSFWRIRVFVSLHLPLSFSASSATVFVVFVAVFVFFPLAPLN